MHDIFINICIICKSISHAEQEEILIEMSSSKIDKSNIKTVPTQKPQIVRNIGSFSLFPSFFLKTSFILGTFKHEIFFNIF